jgi:hypothetical protein
MKAAPHHLRPPATDQRKTHGFVMWWRVGQQAWKIGGEAA